MSDSDDFLQIIWEGCDGSTWHLSGPQVEDEGVLLLPKASNIIDAPVQTLWVKGPFGSKYQGSQVQRRDPVLGFRTLGRDPDDWSNVDSRFRMSWDYDLEGKLHFVTKDGDRYLGLRLLEEPKAYEGDPGGGFSPLIRGDADVVITAAAENPYWVGEEVQQEYVVQSASGTVSDFFFVRNDGDCEMWPKWTASATKAGIQWTLPDWSYGSEEYQRGVKDSRRTVPLPKLILNEHVTAMSHPDEEYLISSLDTNPWARTNGMELIYPVPANTKKTFIPVSWTGAQPGDVIRLSYTRQYSRPWGVRF